jgi:hypothetical protein
MHPARGVDLSKGVGEASGAILTWSSPGYTNRPPHTVCRSIDFIFILKSLKNPLVLNQLTRYNSQLFCKES